MATVTTNGLLTPNSQIIPNISENGLPTPKTSRSLSDLAIAQEVHKKRGKYDPDADLQGDIDDCKLALQLFLESRMLESEKFMRESDPKMQRLYIATGYGLIECVKAFMSFEDKDLAAAIELTRKGGALASKHRKPVSLTSRVAGLVIGGSPVATFKAMTPLQRHAELVYAECLAEKAILGIVYSGDWLSFIKEAINMRACISIYRGMLAYLDAVDAEAEARGEGPTDASVDVHFRSGVYLGMGVVHLILSLLPGRIIPVLQLFGYKGERAVALQLLSKNGGWSKDPSQPPLPIEEEGLRRSLSDMVILIFHLVLSGFTFDGVDIEAASIVLDWNLKRYPSGVFFLFGKGRMALFRAQPQQAIEAYNQAMDEVQSGYSQIQNIALWELAIAHLALWDLPGSIIYWKRLKEEASWSKAVYTYGYAACLVQLGQTEEAQKLMETIPSLLQRIAGKSIPMEKFAARKARKFQAQGGRLLLPALEVSYIFILSRSPRSILFNTILPMIDESLALLKKNEEDPTQYFGTGHGYWDDYCLAYFLRGVCLRYIAYPDPYATVTDENPLPEAAELAKEAFLFLFENGLKIEFDHHLVYFAHYELGKLEACNGDESEARRHLDLVLSGRTLEVNSAGRKGKYSLESALNIRTSAAMEGLEHKKPL